MNRVFAELHHFLLDHVHAVAAGNADIPLQLHRLLLHVEFHVREAAVADHLTEPGHRRHAGADLLGHLVDAHIQRRLFVREQKLRDPVLRGVELRAVKPDPGIQLALSLDDGSAVSVHVFFSNEIFIPRLILPPDREAVQSRSSM